MDRGGATDRSGYELSTCRVVVCSRVCPIRSQCYFFSLVSARQILYHERCIPIAAFAGYSSASACLPMLGSSTGNAYTQLNTEWYDVLKRRTLWPCQWLSRSTVWGLC